MELLTRLKDRELGLDDVMEKPEPRSPEKNVLWLKTVTIRAFPWLRHGNQFALGNVNVFAGPNGYGKTSSFDAIPVVLFGHVPRFSGTRDFSRAGDVLQNKFHREPTCLD